MVEQTSASDRCEAARDALAAYDTSQPNDYERAYAEPLAEALRSLITPPSAGLTEQAIAERVADTAGIDWDDAYDVALPAVRAGIQSAHETWEPEVALRPTQEQMLRWLGIEHFRGARLEAKHVLTQDQIDAGETVGTMVYIPQQYIEQED